MKIVNYGSINLDHVYQVDHILQPGETLLAREQNLFCGGKGLNQSIALAKAGAEVFHAGVVGEDGEILDYRMRIAQSKLSTVKALQSIGFDTVAAGDSFNDLAMILASKAGFFFRATPYLKAHHPEVEAFEDFDELLEAIRKALQ